MEKYKKVVYPFFLLINYVTAYSQGSFDSLLEKAVSVYTNIAGPNSHLYNGSQYVDYDHRIIGNPFFVSSYFSDGSILYDGIFYPHVQMFYEILHDDVVIKNYNGSPLVLAKEKVYSFNYAGHRFVRLVADSSETGMKISGFYDVLFDGSIKLLAKHKKEIVEKISLQYSESYFAAHDEYYILKDDVFYPETDRRSVLYAMKDKRNEVVKFLHDNKIRFKKDIKTDLIKTSAYYDGLKNIK